MKNKELIERLQQFNGDLPVEFMSQCPDANCDAVASIELAIVFKSDRLSSETNDLEKCLVVATNDYNAPSLTSEIAKLTHLEVKEALWNYYAALDRRENGNTAAHTFIEVIEKFFGTTWEQGITLKTEEADVSS